MRRVLRAGACISQNRFGGRIDVKEVTVSDLIKLLDKEKNKRGGATGKERILSISVNGEFHGYITSAKLDGWGDGLVTDVCLEVETE